MIKGSHQTMAAGSFHTVGLKSNGTVVATGQKHRGQCDVSGWRGIVSLSAGSFHTVGLKSDGTVVATGENTAGQCDVSGWRGIVSLSVGGSRTVGLKSDGTVVATGTNGYGQCDVSGWEGIVSLSVGGYHTLGLKSDRTVVAAGYNEEVQCDVSGWRGIVSLSAGGSHTVGLKSDGTVIATGKNDYGQCDVSGWRGIVSLSSDGYHTVGLKSDGTVVATGDNGYGQCNVSEWVLKVPEAHSQPTTLEAKLMDLLQKFPESLDNRQQFLTLLKDYDVGRNLQMNLLIMLYDLGIHQEFRLSSESDYELACSFQKRMEDEYGISESNAKWAVATWIHALIKDNRVPESASYLQASDSHAKSRDMTEKLTPEENYRLAEKFASDSNSEQSDKKAFEYYLKAAEQGHAESQNEVGAYYHGGYGTDVDYEEAFKWFKKAALNNQVSSIFNLAKCYQFGGGVEQNDEFALNYFIEAAEAGHHGAMLNVENIANDTNNPCRIQALLKLSDWYEGKPPHVYKDQADIKMSGECLRLVSSLYSLKNDNTKALEYLIQAAAKDNESALEFFIKNPEAINYLLEVAAKGNKSAIYLLGKNSVSLKLDVYQKLYIKFLQDKLG